MFLDSMPNWKCFAFGIFLRVFIDSITITSNVFTRNISYVLHVLWEYVPGLADIAAGGGLIQKTEY